MRALLPLLACISLPALGAGLNDTGIGVCGDASTNTAPCATVSADNGTYPRQDARYGRDAAAAAGQLTKIGSGEGGFDFTALDAEGQSTAPSSGNTPHPCVRDNLSGLVWEVKSADGGLRDQKWSYSWYDSVHNYGGDPGTVSRGTCKTPGRCDTEKYVADVSISALCGFTDWRMPTMKELEGILHFGRKNPAIDSIYFPNTQVNGFWSGSSVANDSNAAWVVYFDYGYVYPTWRSIILRVRLVRSEH